MRLPVKFSLCSAVLVLGLLASTSRAYAQVQTTAQSTSTQPTGNGTYIVVDPLANVKYDNKYDVSLGMAYDHMKAGPNLLQGSNLGGLNLSGSYWFSRHWGVEGSGRSYWGTSGAAPNAFVSSAGQTENIQGPFVAQYFFVAGPEWLGPHNKHGALIAHAMFGGVYGNFEQDLRGQSPAIVGFYNDQVAPAAIIGGHIDLNRSPQWVFRVTPDAVITRYSINYGTMITQTDVNFAISVGVMYRFKAKRR
ncbi:MAG: hypothetical protein WB561_09725 [Terracidiphilus sp.]